MASLRSKLIHLAHVSPSLRSHILPLLQEGTPLPMSRRAAEDEDLCVVCGKPGEKIRFTVRGMDKTPLAGRLFLKGTALCDKHQDMCDSYTAGKD
jgi:hypothetical protein